MLFSKYPIVKCPVCGQAGKNLTGAALSAASMLPIVGDAIGKGGKVVRAAIKHGDEVLAAVGKQATEGSSNGN